MLKYKLLHPQLAEALGTAGHGSRILIGDGNYPVGTRASPGATRVYLNLAPGLVTVTDVLKVLVDAVPIEAADVMVPESGPEPTIFAEFRKILSGGPPLRIHQRYDFYDLARDPDTAIAIATGEQRIFSNILVTIGVVPPP
jgi:L-fucose mutarotase